MCAISGCLVLHGARPDPAVLAMLTRRALVTGAVRGSDSFGVIVIGGDGVRTWKGVDPPSEGDIRCLVTDTTAAVLATSRATPTTEWRAGQTLDDAQPFRSPHWVVSHNGTVANDHELRQALGVATESGVDSAVLPHLFEAEGFGPGLGRVSGSFALAAVDCRQPDVVHLARNFKPLVLARNADLGVIAFASNPDQLVDPAPEGTLDLVSAAVVEPPPYHRLTITADGDVRLHPLDPPPDRQRALVIASGGLDSTVAAAVTAAEGREVTLLHFRYGCRAEAREVEAVHRVADALGCEVRELPLDWLRDLGGSTLTTGGPITPSEVGAELPHEWVPARNMVMLAAACALADVEGYTQIVTGTNLEEGGTYPDNTQAFMAAMDAAAQLGTMQRPRVVAPLGNLVKHEIVRAGIDVGAPLHATWSCYRDGAIHCGHCGPCFMRRVAFEMTGHDDPVGYERPVVRVRPV